jgi:hypothetical protein
MGNNLTGRVFGREEQLENFCLSLPVCICFSVIWAWVYDRYDGRNLPKIVIRYFHGVEFQKCLKNFI